MIFFYFKKEKLLQILIDYYFICTLVLFIWRKIIYKFTFIKKKEKQKNKIYFWLLTPFEKSKLMVFSLWLHSMYIDYMKSEYHNDSKVKNFLTWSDVLDWFPLGEYFAHREPIYNIRSRRKIYKQTIA